MYSHKRYIIKKWIRSQRVLLTEPYRRESTEMSRCPFPSYIYHPPTPTVYSTIKILGNSFFLHYKQIDVKLTIPTNNGKINISLKF